MVKSNRVIQRINFCRALSKPTQEYLPGHRIIMLSAFFVAVLLLVYWGMYFLVLKDSKQLAAFAAKNEQAALEHLTLVKKYPQALRELPQEERITELAEEIANKSQLISILSEKDTDAHSKSQDHFQLMTTKHIGFSSYLYALGKQILPGMWLTHIRFDDFGLQILLEGKLSEQALLPRFIKNLQSEKAFKGKTFSTFQVTNDASLSPNVQSFTLMGAPVTSSAEDKT